MQCDTDGNLPLDQEDDQDSLFGSPPASPVRGRSPSPALALPSASISTQNVGTIALPGSHHCSELPVTPLALSLGYALSEHTQRPPARPTTATPSERTTPSASRASSTGPGNRPKKRIGKNSKSKESTPRPPPPEIDFPDPSGPIPANFLRNQSALLGTAGLVGGVKPSNLTMHRQPPGTAASNPIVIQDDERVPRRPFQASIQPSSERLEKLVIDPSHLPTPSTQEILSILMGQNDTFIILQSLHKLVAEINRPQTPYQPESSPLMSFRRTPSSFQPSGFANATQQSSFVISNVTVSSTGPPSKKRRLNRVPAGAVDWDVPYPFPEGQGPEYYRTNWVRERGKQLMSQLVTLVKDAVRIAATRKYLQNDWQKKRILESQRALARSMVSKIVEEPKVHGHYKPSTITYGLQGEAAVAARVQVQKVLTDASNSAKASAATSLSIPSPYQSAQVSASITPTLQPSSSFDRLLSSLLAATSGHNLFLECGASNFAEGNTGVQMGSSTPTSDVATQDPDQGLVDNWVNILLQTFPVSAEDVSAFDHNTSSLPSQPDSSVPAPVTSDWGYFDLDSTSADIDPVDSTWYDFAIFNTEESTLSTPGASHATELPEYSSSQDNETAVPQPQLDFIIDPALLAISIPTVPVASTSSTSLESPPSLRSSPIPSLSSFGDVDPSTPNSAIWDTSTPEVFTGSAGDASMTENCLVRGGYRGGGLASQEGHLKAFIGAQSVDKGKGRDIGDSTAQASLPTAVRLETPHFSAVSSSSSLQTSRDKPLGKFSSRQADVMKRAAKRKKQLVAAIANIRTQLWETTIEQGVLLHINKLCTHSV
ncbi:hypothetical protein E4T56_gene6773 [Termitomyces sp. T112]|nr:hypothetical protein E4T56_gene6773 [Termitomyces sp. T112]